MVREPVACFYVITLYTPAMCDSSGPRPEWLIKASAPQQVTIHNKTGNGERRCCSSLWPRSAVYVSGFIVKVKVALPQDISQEMAAAQAAAAAFHGLSKQFSVRYTAAVDHSAVGQQAEVPPDSTAAGGADTTAGGLPAESRPDAQQPAAAGGLLDGLDVTVLLDAARATADSIVAGHDLPTSGSAARQASSKSGKPDAAPAAPGDSVTAQPGIQHGLIVEERRGQNSDSHDSTKREQQNLLAPEAEAEGSNHGSGNPHAEL